MKLNLRLINPFGSQETGNVYCSRFSFGEFALDCVDGRRLCNSNNDVRLGQRSDCGRASTEEHFDYPILASLVLVYLNGDVNYGTHFKFVCSCCTMFSVLMVWV
ncbi:hypothetical protein BM7_CDS0124 [Klebsiella phage Kpn BM7]|nr:hypothetical protein BM7_CDS0124 [Klebsiella phage Kpn BM7]